MEEETMNRFIFATIALLLAAVTAGCNTVQGMGMDLQSTGRAIQRAGTPNN
jgi:predicted small secreted protein